MKRTLTALTFCAISTPTFIHTALAQDHTTHPHMHHHEHHNHGKLAPAGVMLDHTHDAGQWMLSYSYMRMAMNDMQQGGKKISSADVFANGYMMSPLEMTMDMHMFGVMRGLTNEQTLSVMTHYNKKKMTIDRPMSHPNFTTSTEGLGDTSITIIDNLKRYGFKNTVISYGVSLPTGSTDERADTPMGANTKLPYNMQLGSGTYDILLSATTKGNINQDNSYGVQIRSTLRTGLNEDGYRLGNEYAATGWVTHDVTDALDLSAIIDAKYRDGITGEDTDLGSMSPTMDADQSAATTVTAGLDATYSMNGGHIWSLRADLPVHQHVEGIQMANDYGMTLRYRKLF